jgi:hypothetical protein
MRDVLTYDGGTSVVFQQNWIPNMLKSRLLIGMLFLTAMVAIAPAESDILRGDLTGGPTLQLEYKPENLCNPVDAFMYFIPLISLTGVCTETDPNTNFAAGIVNWRREDDTRKNRFTLTCNFDITGSGLYKVLYEPSEMIAMIHQKHPEENTLTGLLDWIQFDGPCQGQVEATGTIRGGKTVVDQVCVDFTREGQRSPVTIAIYDVPFVDNRYDYSNHQNSTIARVTALTFRRTEDSPRMSVQLASVQKATGSEGLISSIKAMVANLFLPAQPISEVGNQTMLDFGQALYHKEPVFTFPVAELLRPSLNKAQAQASAF